MCYSNRIWFVQKASAVSVPSQDPVNLGLLVFRVAGPISLDIAIYEVLQRVRVVFGVQICHLLHVNTHRQTHVRRPKCDQSDTTRKQRAGV